MSRFERFVVAMIGLLAIKPGDLPDDVTEWGFADAADFIAMGFVLVMAGVWIFQCTFMRERP